MGSILCALILTARLGEQNPGYGCAGQAVTPVVRAEVSAETTNKYTGAGWSVRGTVDARPLGRLTLGGTLNHRNGGPWTKDTAGLRVGYLWTSGQALTYRIDLWQATGIPNRVQALEWRQTAARPLDLRIAVYRYRTTPQTSAWGLSTQIGLRLGAPDW